MCGRPSNRDGRFVCSECLMRIPTLPQTGCCRVCARSVEAYEGEFLCEDCGRNPPDYDRVACALRFTGRAREMLLSFKFRRHLWLCNDLADWLEAAVMARFDVSSIDAVIPMPATAWHRFLRGYNQCDSLAREVARRIDRRFDGWSLRRRGMPARQSSLSEADRRENVKGTFVVRRPEMVRGRTLLVVDDILTTGSTLSEAAATLKASGAARVFGAAVARSIRS